MLPQSVALKAICADKHWVSTKRQIAEKAVLQHGRGEIERKLNVTRSRKGRSLENQIDGICIGKKQETSDAMYRKACSGSFNT